MTILNGVRYPTPRLKRPGPAPAPVIPGAPPITLPGIRLWPFRLSQTTGATPRATVVSPRFVGPGVIDLVRADYNQSGNDPPGTWEVYYASDGSGQGINQAITAVPSGTRIFENEARATTSPATFDNVHGVPMQQLTGLSGGNPYPLRLAVLLAEFFIKISLVSSSGAGAEHRLWGYVRVIEGVQADQLANFL